MSGNAERPISKVEKFGEFKYESENFVFILEDVIEGPLILEHIYLATEQAYNNRIGENERGFRRFRADYVMTEEGEERFVSKHAEAWYLYYARGYTMFHVAEELSHFAEGGYVSDVTIGNTYVRGGWRAIYQEEILGIAATLAIRNLLFPMGTIINTHGMPDIIDYENETWIEVKCRNRLRHRETVERQIQYPNTLRNHIRAGKPMKLVRIGYVPGNARIEVWNISSVR